MYDGYVESDFVLQNSRVGKQSAISSIALENSFVCTPTPHSKITRNLIKREF
jgi:hypothetical protein